MPALEPYRITPLQGPHHARVAWAGGWYALTLGGWLVSWGLTPFGPASAAALTALAVGAELISVAVRRAPARSTAWQATGADRAATEWVWLCAWGAQANALGLVAMLSPSLASLLPALIVTAVAEALVLSKVVVASESSTASQALSARAAPPLVQTSPPDDAPDSELEDEHWTRSTHEGRTEEGTRFLSGWVRFELAAEQKNVALTIGFSPAFPTAPEVELDQELESEDADAEVLLEHATPAGMRVTIKRSAAGVPLTGKLLWHAAESDQSSALLRSRLP